MRISAEKALNHPYISQEFMDEEEEDLREEERDFMKVGESPLLTTANEKRKQQKELQRDSCLTFKMGKDNPITGKTETKGTVESGKLSGFGANLLTNVKTSKFSKAVGKENTSTL